MVVTLVMNILHVFVDEQLVIQSNLSRSSPRIKYSISDNLTAGKCI